MSEETILIFFSKYSAVCTNMFQQLQYIQQNMPSVIMYDIDDPKTRQMLVTFNVFKTVPAIILVNQRTGAVSVYEEANAKELIEKAIQVINTNKTKQLERKNTGTPIDSIGLPQDNEPKTSLNTRIQPSEIVETREEMARNTTLPPVEHPKSSSMKNSKVLGDLPQDEPQQGMAMEDIIAPGNQEANISRAAMEKSNALKAKFMREQAERESYLDAENMKRRPQMDMNQPVQPMS